MSIYVQDVRQTGLLSSEGSPFSIEGGEKIMHLDWFIGTMKKTFNIHVKREEVGYEAYDFYHEELDDLLIPAAHLEKLPNPLLIETLSYVDDKGYEWIAGYVLEEETRKKLYEVWIKNGEQIAYEIYAD